MGSPDSNGAAHFLKKEKVGSCVMSENINGETFPVSHGGVSLPFEWYSKEYILKELTNNASYFGDIIEIKQATKAKIKSCRKGKNEYFAYIKFFSINGKSYGIVAGKTNYSNPDLLFDDWKDKKDHRYARIFLKNTSDSAWSDTIIIVNHKPSASEEEDKQAALFIECYLQRKFNLFNS